jgi:hypothetical protein
VGWTRYSFPHERSADSKSYKLVTGPFIKSF